MNDDYLREPDRQRAFQTMSDMPVGSLRKWADAVGWTPGRMQRFVNSLAKRGLAEFTPCFGGTRIRVLVRLSTPIDRPAETDTENGASAPTDAVHRCSASGASMQPSNRDALVVNPATGLTSLKKQASLRKSESDAAPRRPRKRRWPSSADKQDGTELLLKVMNRAMASKFPDDYRPVRDDNWGSHRAAKLWLVEKRISLEDALRLVWRSANMFNRDLAPRGVLPHSLGYFTKSVLAEWRRVQRDRAGGQGEFFAKTDVDVTYSPAYPEPEGIAAAPATVATVMAEFRAEYERAAAAIDAAQPKQRRR